MIDFIKYVFNSIAEKKMRSFLTVLSILIGITAIFTIVSFGLGLNAYIDTLAAESGTDKLFLQAAGVGAPGTDDTFALTEEEVHFIEKIKGVKEQTAMYMNAAEIEFDDEKKFSYFIGIDPEKQTLIDETFTVVVDEGRNLKDGDLFKVVLGYNYRLANKFFKEPVSLGEKVNINGYDFKVVGFYEEIGNPSDDANIYVTFDAFEALYPDLAGKFGWVMMRSAPGEDVEALADKVEEKFRKYRGQEEGKEDFYVQTFADALATFGAVTDILNGILILIALVSMFVAFVNIMNTMYTAVTERTKEIGIMKAIGATRGKILFIFLFEAGFLGLLGGILGIWLGYLISSAGGQIAADGGFSFLQPIFPMSLIIFCLAFATGVGLLSGVLPAMQASKLKPVDALRYE